MTEKTDCEFSTTELAMQAATQALMLAQVETMEAMGGMAAPGLVAEAAAEMTAATVELVRAMLADNQAPAPTKTPKRVPPELLRQP